MAPSFVEEPCSPERKQLRLEQSRQFLRNLHSKVMIWDVEPSEYRKLELEGKGVFDPPTFNPDAEELVIPLNHGSHGIPLRILRPRNGPSKGIFMYLHGGEYPSRSWQDWGTDTNFKLPFNETFGSTDQVLIFKFDSLLHVYGWHSPFFFVDNGQTHIGPQH